MGQSEAGQPQREGRNSGITYQGKQLWSLLLQICHLLGSSNDTADEDFKLTV